MNSGNVLATLLATGAFAIPALAAASQSMGAPPVLTEGHRPGFLQRMNAPAPGIRNPDTPPLPIAPGMPAAHARKFTIIDAPDAGTASGQGTTALAINSSSHVVGYYKDFTGDYLGFLDAPDGSFTEFDVDGGLSQTQATWMNNAGTAAGNYLDTHTLVQEGFVRSAAGKIETFDGGGGSATLTAVNSINDKSETVGDYLDSNQAWHAFLRANDGALTQFEVPGAGTGGQQGTLAYDINLGGTIVGPYVDTNNVYHGFVRAPDGTVSEFDVPGAGTGTHQGTTPVVVNRKGWIAGDYSDASSVYHGFVSSPDGTIATFDAPHAGTGANQGTFAVAINDRGKVAGWYVDSNNVSHGFLRSKNGSIRAFDAPGAGTGAGLGTFAFDINDDNIVAGWDQDDGGVFHGFLKNP